MHEKVRFYWDSKLHEIRQIENGVRLRLNNARKNQDNETVEMILLHNLIWRKL